MVSDETEILDVFCLLSCVKFEHVVYLKVENNICEMHIAQNIERGVKKWLTQEIVF